MANCSAKTPNLTTKCFSSEIIDRRWSRVLGLTVGDCVPARQLCEGEPSLSRPLSLPRMSCVFEVDLRTETSTLVSTQAFRKRGGRPRRRAFGHMAKLRRCPRPRLETVICFAQEVPVTSAASRGLPRAASAPGKHPCGRVQGSGTEGDAGPPRARHPDQTGAGAGTGCSEGCPAARLLRYTPIPVRHS